MDLLEGFIIVSCIVSSGSGIIIQPNRKPPLGFDNKLLKNFLGHELAFNFYHKFQQLFMQLAVFFMFFFDILSFFRFLQHQESHKLL